jgi:hypothetical protein
MPTINSINNRVLSFLTISAAGTYNLIPNTEIIVTVAGTVNVTMQLPTLGKAGDIIKISTNTMTTSGSITITCSTGNIIFGSNQAGAINSLIMGGLAAGNSITFVCTDFTDWQVESAIGTFQNGALFFNSVNNVLYTSQGATPTAGQLNQVIKSVIPASSAVSLTSNTISDVTHITLSPGDWDVWGNVNFPATGSSLGASDAWISSTSVTVPDNSLYVGSDVGVATPTASLGYCVPTLPFNVTSNTNIYLSVVIAFSGSQTVCGGLYARLRH